MGVRHPSPRQRVGGAHLPQDRGFLKGLGSLRRGRLDDTAEAAGSVPISYVLLSPDASGAFTVRRGCIPYRTGGWKNSRSSGSGAQPAQRPPGDRPLTSRPLVTKPGPRLPALAARVRYAAASRLMRRATDRPSTQPAWRGRCRTQYHAA